MSKWLKPGNEMQVRSNRPEIVVEETEDSLIYSLCGDRSVEQSEILRESFDQMSLENDSLNLSSTSLFTLIY